MGSVDVILAIELACLEVPWCDGAGFDRRFALIEAQVGLSRGAIGAVARKAVLGQDRPDVAVVLEGNPITGGCGGGPGRKRCDHDHTRLRRALDLGPFPITTHGRAPEQPVISLAHRPLLL